YFYGKKVSLVCIVSKVKTQLTKNNKMMAFVNIEDRYGSMEAVVFPNVYEKYALNLGDGNAILIRGTLNFKENEEPKLICDLIEKARSNEECKNNSFALNAGQQARNIPAKPVNSNPSALYIRIDDLDTELYFKAKRVLDIFEGPTPVIFYLTNSNRKVKAPSSMWVSLNDVMIKELKFQLGDKNVATK
ncbi:MAG: OB-fold nucleic acid binding domain-containing protein, partial [Ruminococcus sp.]